MKNQATRVALALGATGALAAVVGANGAALKQVVVEDIPLPTAATTPSATAGSVAPPAKAVSAPGVIFLKPGAKRSDLTPLKGKGHRGIKGRNFRRSADPRNGYVIDLIPDSHPASRATKTASGDLKIECIDGDDHAAQPLKSAHHNTVKQAAKRATSTPKTKTPKTKTPAKR